MTRQLRATIGAVVVSLAVASGSSAAPFTPGLDRALTTAERYWGGPGNCLSLDAQIVPEHSLPEDAEGWATIATEPMDCVLYVERHLAKPSEFIGACGVLVHEVGHLHGLMHSEDPQSVMYRYLHPPPAICWRAGLRGLNRPRR